MQQDYVTIAVFDMPGELTVIPSLLDSEGIDFRILNELSAQTLNIYSQAMGGIQLQVIQSQEQEAKRILEEAGVVIKSTVQSGFWQSTDEKTRGMPLIGKQPFMIRLFALVTLVLVLLVFLSMLIIGNS